MTSYIVIKHKHRVGEVGTLIGKSWLGLRICVKLQTCPWVQLTPEMEHDDSYFKNFWFWRWQVRELDCS